MKISKLAQVVRVSHGYPAFKNHCSSANGFSLIEIMIVLGIFSFLTLGFASYVANQSKSFAAMEQKADALELRNYLALVMQTTSVCTCQLNPTLTADNSNDANLKFNSNITDGSQKIHLVKLRTGCADTDPLLAFEGQVLPSALSVKRIEVQNLVPTGVADEWQGDIVISWLPSSMKRSLKPITYRQKFLIDPASPSANRIVNACNSSSGSGSGSLGIGEYVHIPQNTIHQAATDGFLSMINGHPNAIDNAGYICAGPDKADVTLCYVNGGTGPGSTTIRARAAGYAGSGTIIKKGHWFQVQGVDTNGDGGITTGYWLPFGQ